jgi:putative nucleotidyltransferase with HDIG domain
MIPDEKAIKGLWDTYHLPPNKRMHCEIVGKVALALARKLKFQNPSLKINEQLLYAAALLHDIDKNIGKLEGECHPDAGVRILKKEGMDEVAETIRTHPLHMILDENAAPKTIEQQLLFIADKMTKQDFIGLEKRFQLWRTEDKDEISRKVLDASYPKVIALRDEIFRHAGITEEELAKLIK